MFGRNRRKTGVVHTLVGSGSRIEGDLRFDGGCHVDGVVHGSVVAERDSNSFLSISEDGRVEGSVKVPRVVLHGTVQGDVTLQPARGARSYRSCDRQPAL